MKTLDKPGEPGINGSAMTQTVAQSVWNDPRLREHMAFIGSKGGRKGGRKTGASKRRSREHYAKIAEIQRERWKRYRKAKEASIRSGSASK